MTFHTEPKYWKLLLERIEKAYEEGNPKHYLYGRYQILTGYIKSLKKENILKVSNTTIRFMLERIINEGLLVRQADDSYRLAENYQELKEQFLSRIAS